MKQNISQEWIQQSKQRPIGSGFSAHSTCDIAPIVNEPANQGVMAYTVDPDLAEKLWNWTEARTGIRFETSLSILQS